MGKSKGLPLWKIKRELTSAYHQLAALFIQILFPLIRLVRYIRRNSAIMDVRLIKGQSDIGARVVVYLIFPDGDDLTDRIEAIDYFNRSGASVVAVVNGRVDDDWERSLAERCAHVLLRGNSGYDFGGYQAGILMVKNLGHHFDHLHVVNDSVLIPLLSNNTLLNDIEIAATSGFGGAVSMPFDKEESGNDQLILSYWLYFSGSVANSSYFQKYWSSYIPTSSKVLTVRHGERGLSRNMAAHGFPPVALHAATNLNVVLQKLDADALAKTLRYASFTDEAFESRCAALLSVYSDSAEWAMSARTFILDVSSSRNFLHSFCYLAVAVLQIPFVKKTRMRLPHLMRQKYIAAVENGLLPRPSDRVWRKVIMLSR